MKENIYHITTQDAWDAAKTAGVLRDISLEEEGFIHCSYRHQIVSVANNLFKGKKGLIVLGIKRSQVKNRVVDEDLYNMDELFPHIYGPIPVDSVFAVISFPSDGTGRFSLPLEIVE